MRLGSLAICILLSTHPAWGQAELDHPTGNLFIGTWEPDKALAEMLAIGRTRLMNDGDFTLVVTMDSTVVPLGASREAAPDGQVLYAAGEVTFISDHSSGKPEVHPYVVTGIGGELTFTHFRPRGDDRFGRPVSFPMSLIRCGVGGPSPSDRLFLGYPGDAAYPFKRADSEQD